MLLSPQMLNNFYKFEFCVNWLRLKKGKRYSHESEDMSMALEIRWGNEVSGWENMKKGNSLG